MDAKPSERRVRVLNSQGLHARPADLLVRCASEFQADITIARGSERADCRSILSLLTLGATQNTELVISATGHDAEQAVNQIAKLFELGFNELDESTAADMAALPESGGSCPPTT
ncbi:MAG: HPr family phosphocarrier protein [Planctomycetota bacterium]